MSILIRGMEMPINCVSCKVAVTVKDGVLCTPMFRIVKNEKILSGRQQDCPLVEVPPHGRLIDADALEYHAETVRDTEDGHRWLVRVIEEDQILDAPTIIPAEEGE